MNIISNHYFHFRSKPLQIWDKQVRNGHIKRITDPDIQSSVLEIMGTNVSTNYINAPLDPKKTLAIKLPFLVMIIKNLKKYFKDHVKMKQVYMTPGTPGQGVKRPVSEDMKINEDLQSKFRSGVGMLLYLVKHSRPDIANATRELSKSMDGATMLGYQELLRVIKYVLDTEGYGLKLKPKSEDEVWKLTAYTDSDWGWRSRVKNQCFGLHLILWKCSSCLEKQRSEEC